MAVHLRFFCVVLSCVGTGFAMGLSPVRSSGPTKMSEMIPSFSS
jgi:hypothetical protein